MNAAVRAILEIHRLAPGDGVALAVQDENGTITESGDSTLLTTLPSPPPSGYVRAVLRVTGGASPLPNLLSQYCFDLNSRQFESSAVAFARTSIEL